MNAWGVDLKHYINRYGTSTFVETGIYYRGGLMHATAQPFSVIHSIDINGKFVKRAEAEFAKDPRVNCHEGHSPDVLRRLLPEMSDGPIFFWLDAHLDYTGRGDVNKVTPAEEELEVIAELRGGQDVLMVDDLCYYESGKYEHDCSNLNPNREFVRDSSFADRLFGETHWLERWHNGSGCLVITPRGVS